MEVWFEPKLLVAHEPHYVQLMTSLRAKKENEQTFHYLSCCGVDRGENISPSKMMPTHTGMDLARSL